MKHRFGAGLLHRVCLSHLSCQLVRYLKFVLNFMYLYLSYFRTRQIRHTRVHEVNVCNASCEFSEYLMFDIYIYIYIYHSIWISTTWKPTRKGRHFTDDMMIFKDTFSSGIYFVSWFKFHPSMGQFIIRYRWFRLWLNLNQWPMTQFTDTYTRHQWCIPQRIVSS